MIVRDIEATCDFYMRVLGMQVVTFGNGRKALQFGEQKINLHEAGKECGPKALSDVLIEMEEVRGVIPVLQGH